MTRQQKRVFERRLKGNHARYRARHRERIRARNREWSRRHREQKAEYARKYYQRRSSHLYSLVKKYRKQAPEKARARTRLNWAVRTGKIKRPSTCSRCGIKCKPHAHHKDYSKPYVVVWLCTPCHGQEHRRA